ERDVGESGAGGARAAGGAGEVDLALDGDPGAVRELVAGQRLAQGETALAGAVRAQEGRAAGARLDGGGGGAGTGLDRVVRGDARAVRRLHGGVGIALAVDGVTGQGVEHVLGGVGAHADELAEGADGGGVGGRRARQSQAAGHHGGGNQRRRR